MPEVPELEQIRELEDKNYNTNKDYLKDTYLLAHDVTELYDLLRQLISESHTPPKDEIISGFAFLLSCRYQLTISCLAILRGHLTDSFQSTRRAIEACAFSSKIFRHPHLAMDWIRASDEDNSYRIYQDKFFGMKKLFPESDVSLKELGQRYNQCSKELHNSAYSYARRLDINKGESWFNVTFQYFEITPEDMGEPARTFLFTISTHIIILKVLADLFKDEIKYDRSRWDINYNAVDAKYAVHIERWLKTIKV